MVQHNSHRVTFKWPCCLNRTQLNISTSHFNPHSKNVVLSPLAFFKVQCNRRFDLFQAGQGKCSWMEFLPLLLKKVFPITRLAAGKFYQDWLKHLIHSVRMFTGTQWWKVWSGKYRSYKQQVDKIMLTIVLFDSRRSILQTNNLLCMYTRVSLTDRSSVNVSNKLTINISENCVRWENTSVCPELF